MLKSFAQFKVDLKEQRKQDAEYLRECLTRTSRNIGMYTHNLWYENSDTLLSVAQILEGEILFTASDAIRFFEKPYHFEKDMTELIETLEDD